jgi:hypothetical protein
MITNPISANQIVDVSIDLKCLRVECPTLPNVLQTIVDKICEVVPIDNNLEYLDFKCFSVPGNVPEFYQEVIDKICAISSEAGQTSCTYDYCSSDNWDCEDATCLVVNNPCNPVSITNCDVIQALIKRTISQGNIIKDLCEEINTIKNRLNTLEAQLTIIQTTCCNV